MGGWDSERSELVRVLDRQKKKEERCFKQFSPFLLVI